MNAKQPNRPYKSERLNYIVNRLRHNQGITPSRLAEELKVSERTIYRDLRLLEADNMLHKRYSRREGRYMLEMELNLSPLTLTPSEALALFTAASNPALSRDNFYAEDLNAALAKVASTLMPPDAQQAEADAASETGGTMPRIVDSIQRPTLEMIRRAIRSNRKLNLRYWGTEGECVLTVAPYDLRQVQSTWRLLANSEEHNAIRTFRISRIRAVEILSERFRYPRHFSPDAQFARAVEADCDNDILVRLRFASEVAPLVADAHRRQFSTVETMPDGDMTCSLSVNSMSEVRWWVLSYGDHVEVLEPGALRAEIASTAANLTAMYGSNGTA